MKNELLRRLWERMGAVYGHTWTSARGLQPEGAHADEWSMALAGLSPDQMRQGIEACRLSVDAFPPTPPAFRLLCLGLPSFEAVRAELLRRDSSQRSCFALAVWRRMDGYAWRHAEASRADAMLRDAYEAARAAVMAGEPLPEPLPEIEREPEPPRPAGPSEAGRQALAALMAGMGLDRGAHA